MAGSTYKSISIHAPARGATVWREGTERIRCYFNPRSREGSDMGGCVSLKGSWDFNPRSREGSDPRRRYSSPKLGISIHAPARGATWTTEQLTDLRYISIHAPARGATFVITFQTDCIGFQSTLPRGERPPSGRRSDSRPRISIHAPARGATHPKDSEYDILVISIHAPARGATYRLPGRC